MRRLLGFFVGTLLLVVSGSALAIGSDPSITIYAGLSADDNLSTFVDLLDQSGLADTLKEDGPFTVFAPPNSVFEKLNKDGIDLTSDPAKLQEILKRHIVKGTYKVKELQDAKEGSLMTLQGEPLKVTTTATGLKIDGVGLDPSGVDNSFSDGAVHVVTGVIGVSPNADAAAAESTAGNAEGAADSADKTADQTASGETAASAAPATAPAAPAPAAPAPAEQAPAAQAPAVPAPAAAQLPANAMVRVANLSPNTPALTLTLASKAADGTVSSPEAFDKVAYKSITDYLELPGGDYTLTVSPQEGVDQEQDISLNSGSYTTLAAVGLVLPPEDAAAEQKEDDSGGFFAFIGNLFTGGKADRDVLALHVVVVNDDLSRSVDADKTLVRAVNASPGTADIDLAVVGEQGVLNDNLGFGEVGSYASVGNGELEIRIAGSEAASISLADAGIQAGNLNTVYLIGTSLETAPITTLVTSDAPVERGTPAGATTGQPAAQPAAAQPAGGAAAAQPSDEAAAAEPSDDATAAQSTGEVGATPAPVAEETVVDVVMNDPSLSTFAKVLTQSGELDTLRGSGPFTLFAPTDSAFSDAFSGDELSALMDNPDALKQLVQHHLVDGPVMFGDAQAAGSLTMADGTQVKVNAKDEQSLMLGDATVLVAGQQAGNGTVRSIDKVLLPDGFDVAPQGAAPAGSTAQRPHPTLYVGG